MIASPLMSGVEVFRESMQRLRRVETGETDRGCDGVTRDLCDGMKMTDTLSDYYSAGILPPERSTSARLGTCRLGRQPSLSLLTCLTTLSSEF